MDFKLSCGHTVRVDSRVNWFRVLRDHPRRSVRDGGGHECMRCYLERKAARAEAFFGTPTSEEIVG